MSSAPRPEAQRSQKAKKVMSMNAAMPFQSRSAAPPAPLAYCARNSGGSSPSSEDEDADASLIYVPPANKGELDRWVTYLVVSNSITHLSAIR